MEMRRLLFCPLIQRLYLGSGTGRVCKTQPSLSAGRRWGKGKSLSTKLEEKQWSFMLTFPVETFEDVHHSTAMPRGRDGAVKEYVMESRDLTSTLRVAASAQTKIRIGMRSRGFRRRSRGRSGKFSQSQSPLSSHKGPILSERTPNLESSKCCSKMLFFHAYPFPCCLPWQFLFPAAPFPLHSCPESHGNV